MLIRDRVHSRSRSFGIVPIGDRVHSGSCPLGIATIRNDVLSGLCPFGMVSIQDSVHSGWCPFATVSIRDRVRVFCDCVHDPLFFNNVTFLFLPQIALLLSYCDLPRKLFSGKLYNLISCRVNARLSFERILKYIIFDSYFKSCKCIKSIFNMQ